MYGLSKLMKHFKLKNAMVSTLVLALPNYNLPFIIEADASGDGIGAVVMKEGRLIAYFSRDWHLITKPILRTKKSCWPL